MQGQRFSGDGFRMGAGNVYISCLHRTCMDWNGADRLKTDFCSTFRAFSGFYVHVYISEHTSAARKQAQILKPTAGCKSCLLQSSRNSTRELVLKLGHPKANLRHKGHYGSKTDCASHFWSQTQAVLIITLPFCVFLI